MPRITVQIDPSEDYFLTPPDPPPPPLPKDPVVADNGKRPKGETVFADFWGAVSPSLTEASAGRLDSALQALSFAPGLGGPRLDDMRRITDTYGRDILRHTVGTRVSPALVAAIISVESSGRSNAVSPAGAQGVMQLMPATAERFGVTDWREVSENIRGGVAYLDWLAGEFGLDPLMVLAGYNAGEGAVRKHQGVPPYAETRAYVPKVLAAWKVASGLCLKPPELISDGCVFVSGS
ncbi:MAG: lytic transglycosylase domain-containing protein [Pseudomonadota bacterium]